jgi:hypothetical protein
MTFGSGKPLLGEVPEITGTVNFDMPGDPGLIVPALKNTGRPDRKQQKLEEAQ